MLACIATLSLGISSTAMAADIDAVDLFVGNFAGVASLDFDKLASNQMINDVISKNAPASATDDIFNELKAAGIDYKKDIDTVAIAVDEKGHACTAIDGKKSLKDAMDYEAKKNNYTASDYNGVSILTDGKFSVVLLNDKRILACENKIDIKPMIDNAKADKPKLLKDRDSVIYKAFQATDKKADIRFGGKMTKYLKDKSKSYKLDNAEKKSIAVSDIDSGSVSISFAKGMEVSMIAVAKSDAIAAQGAAIINETLASMLDEQMLNDMGIGFVKKAISVAADKKNVNAKVKFNDSEMTTLMALLGGMAGGAPAKK